MKFLLLTAMASGGGSGGAPQKPSPPVSNGEKIVTSTIVITKAGTYDFNSVMHVWAGAKWNCNAGRENGPQILRIEADNVVVKNFHFKGELGDPVHIATCGKGQGNQCSRRGPVNVTLDGIYGHACEDLITVGTPGAKDITIKNSYLMATPRKAAWDKTIQINFGTNIKVENNIFDGGARCVRFKPNTQGEVTGNTFYDCKHGLVVSSNDADIPPMKNGPSTVRIKGNTGMTAQLKGSQAIIQEQ